ncbi:glyoxalase [Paraburkholderia caballeronis]|nr:glyoxalase [Paraburkholderia caballeronis]
MAVALFCALTFAGASAPLPAFATAQSAAPSSASSSVAVGPQYDTTHVYVPEQDLDAFVKSFLATFGGHASPPVELTVTPTPSRTLSQYVQTPVGMLSVFAFQTPIPYPFGDERTGYLVTDMGRAVHAARVAGADVVVESFDDPIGKDAVIRWPGGVDMQLYWHTKTPSYAPLATVPDNRVYVSQGAANEFVRRFLRFAGGKVVSDARHADAAEIGRPGETMRRIRITSPFGAMLVFATDGKLPWPFGRETTGYAVQDLAATLAKAQAAGATVLVGSHATPEGDTAVVQFPGGYIAEIHETASR